ncbi:hypothetical protein ACHAW5_006755 [Stephanodiscus triporus]|uniref:Uncharacterized protein n=1 Tax=Stephanodiscus triporus TaxID=2934178 RepID=A0ABD3NSQ6_9STRA
MRWHCRLSHVSAHTAMVTLSLEDVLRDPKTALGRVLAFVRREDWEWEGRGGGGGDESRQSPEGGEETRAADDLIVVDRGGFLLCRCAFAGEMDRSSNLTSWPCPSFWEGVDGIGGGSDNDDGDDQTRVIRRISGEMVPNCIDNDPFARCTVNKDRCEVKGDAKCNN